MAGGFWKGLFHGAIIGAVGLVGLSLMVPLQETTVEALPAGVSDEARVPVHMQSAPKTESPPGTPDIPAIRPAKVTKPVPSVEKKSLAAMVNLAPGSEFGRGDDTQLQRPAPFAPGGWRTGLSEPPAIIPPAADSVLVAVYAASERPRANSQGHNITTPISTTVEETPEFSRPAGLIPLAEIMLPDIADSSGRDRLPESAPVQAVARGAVDIAVDTGVTPVPPDVPGNIPSEPQQVSHDAAPALLSPAFDLSMPPDLTSLRALQRN